MLSSQRPSIWKSQTYRDRHQIHVYQKLRERVVGCKRHRKFRGMELCWGSVGWLYEFVKNPLRYILKRVNCTECKLCLNKCDKREEIAFWTLDTPVLMKQERPWEIWTEGSACNAGDSGRCASCCS